MAITPAREYIVNAVMRVVIRQKSMIADSDEAVIAGVRHRIRLNLPEAWTTSGLRFEHDYLEVEVTRVERKVEKEAVV